MTMKQRHLIAYFFFLPLLLASTTTTTAQVWTVISIDAKGDSSDPLADAAQLSYRYDKEQDVLWFRVALYGKANEQGLGVDLAFDTGGDEAAKMNWWGTNKDFRFDRFATARLERRGDRYEGTNGVANVIGVKAGEFNNLVQNNLHVEVENDAIIVGVKRSDVTEQMKMKVIVSVGSNAKLNDDIPNVGAATIDLSAPRTRASREIDTARNNFTFPADYRTLADGEAPVITKSGKGPQTLILIPGVYSGKEVFDGFISRNQSKYKLYKVIPPGLMGTAARELPAETISYGERTWTRQLKRDILELIKQQKLSSPIIISHGFPGSLAAHEISIEYPTLVGGIIDVAATAVQPLPYGRGKLQPKQRATSIDEAWAQKWFKFVTPETWETNNYPAEMFANEAVRAERVRQQVESTLLQVKIRYLTEFMAADQTDQLHDTKVPLLVLRPGFNEKILSNPSNIWFKQCFLDSWDEFSSNPRIQVLTIADARALILDDQPQATDEAIKKFVVNLPKTPGN